MTSKMIAMPARGAAARLGLISLFALASVCGCGDGDPTGVNEPPVVSVQSPQPGPVSPIGFIVRATASDENGVDHVEVFLDEQLVAIIVAEPYDIYVTSLGLLPGNYPLRVRAVDAGGATRDAVVTVTVPVRTYRRLTLTEPGFRHMEPAWDALGVQIAYSRQGAAVGATKNIYAIAANVTEGIGQQVTDGLQQDGSAVYSPDGQWLAFESNRTGYYQIYVTNIAAGDTTRLTNIGGANQRRPTWMSAGGSESWIAYDSDRSPGGMERRDIYMMRLSIEGDSIRIVDPAPVDSLTPPDLPADTNPTDDTAPQWSNFGVLFQNSKRSGVYAVTIVDPFLPEDPLAILVNGTNQNLVEDFAPTLSPFDAYVAFSEGPTLTEKLWVVPTGGTGEIRIEIAPGAGIFLDGSGFPDAFDAAWNPAGTRIAFVSTKTGTEEIWIVE